MPLRSQQRGTSDPADSWSLRDRNHQWQLTRSCGGPAPVERCGPSRGIGRAGVGGEALVDLDPAPGGRRRDGATAVRGAVLVRVHADPGPRAALRNNVVGMPFQDEEE